MHKIATLQFAKAKRLTLMISPSSRVHEQTQPFGCFDIPAMESFQTSGRSRPGGLDSDNFQHLETHHKYSQRDLTAYEDDGLVPLTPFTMAKVERTFLGLGTMDELRGSVVDIAQAFDLSALTGVLQGKQKKARGGEGPSEGFSLCQDIPVGEDEQDRVDRLMRA